MAANAREATPVLLRPMPRNGLEPAPRPAMERWYCDGWNDRKNEPCRALLMEVALGAGKIRVKCGKCNAWNVRETVPAAPSGPTGVTG